ncbi:chemotaxis protein CheW [bacterium]|nr:chemotaxis protein CheW [bacterium]
MVQNNLISQTYSALGAKEDIYENYTIIEIDNKNYAIQTDKILEIVKLIELDYPEGMLSCILGIIRYKQEPVGVIDLREVFKKERIVYDLNTKVLIVQAGEGKTAIAADKVLDIKKLEKEKIHPLSYQRDSEFFEGVYSSEGEDLYIINMKKTTDFICGNPQLFSNVDNKRYIVDDAQSKEILTDRKNALIELENATQPNISLYDSGVSFIINGIKYYINMASVKEFYKVKKSKFIKVPCTKDYIFGLINIKGDYITVIDIRRLFNNSKTTVKEKSTIIILNSDQYKIGILADEICESITVDFDEIIQNRLQKNDENKMPEFVKDDEIYQVLDIEQLLKDERLTVC